MPRKWQINLSLAWLKGCDIIVAKVRFKVAYQQMSQIFCENLNFFLLWFPRVNLSKILKIKPIVTRQS